MKYILGTLLVLFMLPQAMQGQQSTDRRTQATKIADILARFPAPNQAQYEANVAQLENLGEDGLKQMLSMLSPQGKGNNTSLEYAISAFSSTVMKDKQKNRKMAVTVYCDALKQTSDVMNREFIIRQLQLTGNDESLTCLQPFLNDQQLAGPAARAIAQVGSEAAGKMLLEALASSPEKASVIEALGYVRYTPAVSAIQAEYEKGSAEIKKVAAYALARMGDASSATLLHDAAKKENFTLDNSGATSSYLVYIKELAAKGKPGAQKATTLATQLMNETAAAKKTQARIAALALNVHLNGEKSQPLLYKAMKDENIEYRAAALKLAERFRNESSTKQWISQLKSASPEAKVQIINYLADGGDNSGATAVIDDYLVAERNQEVRHAAINAIAKLEAEKNALPLLVEVLKKGSKEDVAVAKAALMRVKTKNPGQQLTGYFNNMPPASVAAALEVIAARRDASAGKKVFELLNNNDTTISNAAYKALPYVVKQEDLSQLYTLLTSANPEEVPYIQQAVTAASSEITDTVKRTSVVTAEMSRVAEEKQYLFVPTLAAIGGRDALDAVQQLYAKGDRKTNAAVVSALSRNRDARSASMLLKIAQTSSADRDQAVDGYINIIQKGSFTADQKVLMLQEAMALASKTAQRRKIIQEAGKNGTYLSLVFAGKYINDAELQQDAAFAVMNIALGHPEFNGQHVRDLLQTVSNVIKGGDAGYQREAIRKHLAEMPAGAGYVPLFNGKDLKGWKGLVDDPIKRSRMSAKQLAEAQKKADAKIKEGWEVKDGLLIFTGHGDNLATEKQYGDFEMLVDWKITKDGDAGIYLRGTPQVQIWDTSRRDVGAQVGSGGLYNNEKNPAKPLVVADNPIGEWNTFYIKMIGDRVTVYLNGKLVTDSVVLENYWDRKQPIFPREQIELQAHGTYVAYRNLYIKELPGSKKFELPENEKKENFKVLFDGSNLDEWVGNKKDYVVEKNELVVKPSEGEGGGNLFTKDEYADFNFRFEFLLTPGANNGLAIRAPLEGDAAYTGMELQILDNEADIYKDLKPYQYHGSVYGVIAAKRGFLKPVGEWNQQEVIVKGTKIKVILNGTVILDGDIREAREKGTLDKQDHPGLKRDKGHIGFLGHGSVLRFRNIRIKEL